MLDEQHLPKPGTHRARVETVEKSTTRFGPAVKFSYRTDDGPVITEFTGSEYTTTNKLGRRVKAILGEPVELPVYVEDLIGTRVKVTAEEREDSRYLRVTEVRRIPEEDHDDKEYEDTGVPF